MHSRGKLLVKQITRVRENDRHAGVHRRLASIIVQGYLPDAHAGHVGEHVQGTSRQAGQQQAKFAGAGFVIHGYNIPGGNTMAVWEFCKIERETVGPAESGPAKGSGKSGGEKFNDRLFLFRMTAVRFTPDGLVKFAESEEYRGFVRDDPMHNQMGEKLLAKLGGEGWEPFFTDTRSSPDFFSWHLKRQVET
jgi:hypothetical protein